MADEQKTEETTSSQTDGITITQAKLDELINSKFKQGAEKAEKKLLETLGVDKIDDLQKLVEDKKAQEEANKSELEKLNEMLEAEKKAKEELTKKVSEAEKRANINSMIARSNVDSNMVDYFAYEYEKASGQEGFTSESFLEELKEKKPFLFEGKKQTDTSTNKENKGKTLSEQIQGITSIKDLEALQRQL